MVALRLAKNVQILAILGTLFLCAHGCPAEFQGVCECGLVHYGEEGALTYVTNCTNTDFQDTWMLKELPPETEVLIFVGNRVTDLPQNILGNITIYEKLHTIDLSRNKIQSVKGKTFHRVPNVQKLILDDNDIYITSKDHHPRMFSNLGNLQELHLKNAFTEKVKPADYLKNLAETFVNGLKNLRVLNMESNEITEISTDEFCSLSALEELYMANNGLSDIGLNFSCLPRLRKLDFGRNRISHLESTTLGELEKTWSNRELNLVLTGNPFNCDCHMLETYEWMNKTKIVLINKGEFYCQDGFPLSNKGKPILSLPLHEFQCFDSAGSDGHASSVHYVVLALGIIIFSVVIILLLYKNKKQVSLFASRLAEPVRNKFQYVSLDRRDVTIEV